MIRDSHGEAAWRMLSRAPAPCVTLPNTIAILGHTEPVLRSQQVGFSIEEDANAPAGKHARRVTKRTTQAIAMLLLPVSLLMVRSAARGPDDAAMSVHMAAGSQPSRQQPMAPSAESHPRIL